MRKTTCLPLLVLLLLAGVAAAQSQSAQPPRDRSIDGKYLDLLGQAGQLTKLRRSNFTIEFWIRPDQPAVQRPSCMIFLMSNRAGSDVNAFSVAMHRGKLHCTIFATYIKSKLTLTAEKWTHVALTLNADTVNKRARLWINGKLDVQTLVLNKWPPGFYYVGMFGDPWLNTRVFTGRSGGIRLANSVRYKKPFQPPGRFNRDKSTVLVLQP